MPIQEPCPGKKQDKIRSKIKEKTPCRRAIRSNSPGSSGTGSFPLLSLPQYGQNQTGAVSGQRYRQQDNLPYAIRKAGTQCGVPEGIQLWITNPESLLPCVTDFPLLPSVTVYTLHKVTNSSYTVNHCMVTPGNAYTLQKVIKSVLCAPTAGLSTPIHPVVLSRMSRHICRSSIKVRQYGIHVFPRIAQKTALLYTNPDGNGIRWKPGAVPPL